jgi:hypothetical protein
MIADSRIQDEHFIGQMSLIYVHSVLEQELGSLEGLLVPIRISGTHILYYPRFINEAIVFSSSLMCTTGSNNIANVTEQLFYAVSYTTGNSYL